jgi:hypothetical protein
MLLLFSLLSSLLVGGRSLNYDTPYKNERAFAALRDDGTLVLWGGSGTGEGLGIVPNVIAVASTLFAYAVIKADGTLLCSGSGSHGGNCPSPPANLRYLYSASHASAGGAFAAVDNVDAVFAWGGGAFGGDTTLVNDLLVPGVEFVNSFARGFAAYTKEGVLVPWSFESVGNRNSNFDDFARGDIVKTYGNEYAACALTASQTVFCWGEPSSGANEPAGLSNVKDLYYTDTAFAALKVDGSVVVWGHTSNGGSLGAVDATNVAYIFSTRYAFAALKLDDTVVAWGQGSNGGSIPGGTVSNVLNVFASDLGFVALKQDGSVFGWGYMSTPPGGMDPIVDIVTGRSAYAALSSTGKVYYWGEVGGYVITAATTAALASGTVSAIYSLTRAFAAVYGPNRNVVCWGWTSYGGDCSALSASLTGVKYIFGNEIRRTSVLNAPTPSPNNAPTANPSTAEPSMAPRRPTASPTWSMAPSRAPGGFALFPTASPSASPSAAPTVSDDPFITGSLNRNMTYYCRPRNYVSAPNGIIKLKFTFLHCDNPDFPILVVVQVGSALNRLSCC